MCHHFPHEPSTYNVNGETMSFLTRWRDRQRETETDRETERNKERQRDRETNTQSDTQKHRETQTWKGPRILDFLVFNVDRMEPSGKNTVMLQWEKWPTYFLDENSENWDSGSCDYNTHSWFSHLLHFPTPVETSSCVRDHIKLSQNKR